MLRIHLFNYDKINPVIKTNTLCFACRSDVYDIHWEPDLVFALWTRES